MTFFRSLAGFGFPLFAPAMYNALGYGKGDTILAAVSILIGVPAYVLPFSCSLSCMLTDVARTCIVYRPFLFWKYGERIRHASKFARQSIGR